MPDRSRALQGAMCAPRSSFAVVVASIVACSSTPRGVAPGAPAGERQPIALTYLGVAGWQLDAGAITILADPYFSRPDLEAPLVPDPAAKGERRARLGDPTVRRVRVKLRILLVRKSRKVLEALGFAAGLVLSSDPIVSPTDRIVRARRFGQRSRAGREERVTDIVEPSGHRIHRGIPAEKAG